MWSLSPLRVCLLVSPSSFRAPCSPAGPTYESPALCIDPVGAGVCKLVVKLNPDELIATEGSASASSSSAALTRSPSAVTRSLRKLFSSRPTMSMEHVLEVASGADTEVGAARPSRVDRNAAQGRF